MTTDPRDIPPIDDWNQLLAGKVAVVTGGGAEGIGGAVTELFATHGAIVEVAEIDRERADAVTIASQASKVFPSSVSPVTHASTLLKAMPVSRVR